MLELYLSLIFDPNDTDIFEEIYYEYENYVLKVAKYYVKDYHYAQDASQIAFKNIVIYIDKIKPLSKDLLKGKYKVKEVETNIQSLRSRIWILQKNISRNLLRQKKRSSALNPACGSTIHSAAAYL